MYAPRLKRDVGENGDFSRSAHFLDFRMGFKHPFIVAEEEEKKKMYKYSRGCSYIQFSVLNKSTSLLKADICM